MDRSAAEEVPRFRGVDSRERPHDTLSERYALAALREMRMRWSNPKHTPEMLIELFEKRGMSLTAVHLLNCLAAV